ncbi:hypothetical protein CONPUDRAFT_74967 [Coniophora puteana RWD-64-598 SS2]|uniref:Uncharacterized protein n=1 Tax=Coniophora puteana (strain RWD-64-598) TaxID=741705 RepID=A0A5M3MG54_CONPW|nr:uncharacterized protein CONPUDRAFT_74967 [Coniophora puteana RWD-64-598 SS2]EIW78228.1 hypothetical protein CONPUDRAFT_74967 [Coniophora puteana RWD-64-598 SS2]
MRGHAPTISRSAWDGAPERLSIMNQTNIDVLSHTIQVAAAQIAMKSQRNLNALTNFLVPKLGDIRACSPKQPLAAPRACWPVDPCSSVLERIGESVPDYHPLIVPLHNALMKKDEDPLHFMRKMHCRPWLNNIEKSTLKSRHLPFGGGTRPSVAVADEMTMTPWDTGPTLPLFGRFCSKPGYPHEDHDLKPGDGTWRMQIPLRRRKLPDIAKPERITNCNPRDGGRVMDVSRMDERNDKINRKDSDHCQPGNFHLHAGQPSRRVPRAKAPGEGDRGGSGTRPHIYNESNPKGEGTLEQITRSNQSDPSERARARVTRDLPAGTVLCLTPAHSTCAPASPLSRQLRNSDDAGVWRRRASDRSPSTWTGPQPISAADRPTPSENRHLDSYLTWVHPSERSLSICTPAERGEHLSRSSPRSASTLRALTKPKGSTRRIRRYRRQMLAEWTRFGGLSNQGALDGVWSAVTWLCGAWKDLLGTNLTRAVPIIQTPASGSALRRTWVHVRTDVGEGDHGPGPLDIVRQRRGGNKPDKATTERLRERMLTLIEELLQKTSEGSEPKASVTAEVEVGRSEETSRVYRRHVGEKSAE